MFLAIFDLRHPNASYQVSSQLTFRFRRRSKIKTFSRWWPSWISDQNDFSYFFIYKLPRCFLLSFKSIGLLFWRRKQKQIFKMATTDDDGRHSGFLTGTILAIFDQPVTLMLPAKFQVNWLFSSGEKVKNRFSRRQAWWSSVFLSQQF